VKLKDTGGLLVTILALAAVGAVVAVILRVTVETLQTALLVLAGGAAGLLLLIGIALVVRAKQSGGPQERIIERHTHTIEREGRIADPPKIHVLNQQPGRAGMFPAVLRAAYLAGVRGLPSGEIVEGETRDLTAEWDGEIRE